jgi:hypothetical protein
MESVVGIFHSVASAQQAVEGLLSVGVNKGSIIFLSSESPEHSAVLVSTEEKLDSVRTTDAEDDGVGKAVGALMGGAVGASAGLAGGAAIASLLVPGVGPIFAIGLGAAAVLGLGGAAAGAKAGDVVEHEMEDGIPKDDVQFYHEALRRGHSLVIANVDSEGQLEKARKVFKQNGSEDVDTLRKELRTAA